MLLNKCKKIFILTMATILATSTVLAAEVPYTIEEKSGAENYLDKLKNTTFTDIESHWSKDAINHMAGLDVYRGNGTKRFGPEDQLQRDEALAAILKAMGKQDQAIALNQGNPYWGQGYIDLAKQLKIVSPEETTKIEEIPVEIQDDIDERIAQDMIDYEKDPSNTDAELNDIENNMTGDYQRKYTWEKSVTREQVVAWIARAKKLEPKPWSQIEKIYNLKDWNQMTREHLPLVETILDAGIFTADSKGNFKPREIMTKAEMATVLKRIDDEWLKDRGFEEGYAKIDLVDTQVTYEGPDKIIETLYTIDTLDDKTYKRLKTAKSSNSKYNKGFLVYKDGKMTTQEALKADDYIRYYIKNDAIQYVEVEKRPSTYMRGIIKSIEDGMYTLENLDTKTIDAFQLDPRVNLFINDLKAFEKDFIVGLEVKAEIKGGKIVTLNGVANKGESGKIEVGTRYVKGKVVFVDPENKTLTLDTDELNGSEIKIATYVPIIKNNKAINIDQIKPGDFVRFEMPKYDSNEPSKVFVAGQEKQMETFVKGTLGSYNSQGKSIAIKDPKYFDGGRWVGEDTQKQYPLTKTVKTYFQGFGIDEEDIANFQGREVYVGTVSYYGQEKADHVFVKEGYERTYDDKIQDIAYGAQRLKIDYTDVLYNEGTLILKDGRLIDPYNLEKGDSIKVYTNEKGSAALITVANPPTSEGYKIVKNPIKKQTKYTFDLVNYEQIVDEAWKKINDTRDTFQISDETKVYDLRKETDPANQNVTIEDFTKYRNEVITTDKSFVGKEIYAVVNGDMAVALSVVDKGAASQIITIAEIESKDDKTKKVTLKNAKDWSEFTSTWVDNNSGLIIDGTTMLVVKGDKAVDFDKTAIGQQVYLMRWNDYGFVMLIPE